MTNPNEPINQGLRRAFTSGRFTVDGQGRLLRGPDDDAETAPETGPTEDAPPMRPGKADGGAQGHLPEDPSASINRTIRAARGQRGS